MKARVHFITVKLVHFVCLIGVAFIGIFILAVLGMLLNAPPTSPVHIDTPVNFIQSLQSI